MHQQCRLLGNLLSVCDTEAIGQSEMPFDRDRASVYSDEGRQKCIVSYELTNMSVTKMIPIGKS